MFAVIVALSTGLILVFADGVTEVSLPLGFGFKKVTAKAIVDAQAISSLRVRVENQSATVDAIAKKANDAAELAGLAQKKLLEANVNLSKLQSTVKFAEDSMRALRKSSETTMLIADAENDDRQALNKLLEISQDNANPDAAKAASAWRTITVAAFSALQLEFKPPWRSGLDPQSLDIKQLEAAYDASTLQPHQIGILQFIASRTDFDKRSKLDLFLKVAKSAKSIKNSSYALHQFYEGTKSNLPIFDLDQATAWWALHRDEFANVP